MKTRWLNLALGVLFALLFVAGLALTIIGALGCATAPKPEITLPAPPAVRY